jgi:hypothetical protein
MYPKLTLLLSLLEELDLLRVFLALLRPSNQNARCVILLEGQFKKHAPVKFSDLLIPRLLLRLSVLSQNSVPPILLP